MLKAIACAAVLIGALTFGSAAAAQEQNFTLVNNTGQVVVSVNVSPADQENWGPDILGSEVLANGEQAEVAFEPKDDICVWDLRVVYDDGQAGEWRGVDLCEISTVNLTQ